MPTLQDLVDTLRSQFDLGIKNVEPRGTSDLFISAREDKLLEVMAFLATECNARLANQVACDAGDRIEIIDILLLNHVKARVHVKFDIDKSDKKTTSIKNVFNSAAWLEKYQNKFLGIEFVPGQHDATEKPASVQDRIPWVPVDVDDSIDKSIFLLEGGIHDPKLDILPYTWAKTEQTMILKAKCQIGHFHRGLVHFAERTAADELPFVLSRTCWHDKFALLSAYAMAMERALGPDASVPVVANYWRALACEIERIQDHERYLASWLSWLGEAVTASRILDSLEAFQPIEHSMIDEKSKVPFIAPGGILFDPVKANLIQAEIIEQILKAHEQDVLDLLITPRNARDPFSTLKGAGKIDPVAAMNDGVSGPFLRASGLPFDARADFPYGTFSTGLVKWDVVTAPAGDVQARIVVHVQEILQSLRIAYQLLDLMREAPGTEAVLTPLGQAPAGAEGLGHVEGARGDMQVYIRTGASADRLDSIRVQAPDYLTFTAIEHLFGRIRLRAYPAIVQSFNPCWTCIDL
jgi:NADH-quinone oxidoreductase subunit D